MSDPKQPGGTEVKAWLLALCALILATVFVHEGGYVNDPADPGGATNHGITERVAREHGYKGKMRDLKRHCGLEIVADTARGEREVCADTILFQSYIVKPGYLPLVAIDPAVAEEVIDTAVNMGPARPNRFFQRSVNATCGTGLAVDGLIGPMTVKAWGDCRASLGRRACVSMLDRLDRHQEAEYDRLVRVNPRLRKFRRGWQNLRIGNVDRRLCVDAA